MTHGIVVLVAGVLIAWIVAGATVVRLVSRIWLRHWAEQGLRGPMATLASITRPRRMLAAASIAVGLVLALAGVELASNLDDPASRVALVLLACAAVVIFLAQLIARAVARHWPSALAPWTLPVLHVAEVLTSPLLVAVRYAPGAPSLAPPMNPAAERAAIESLLREAELEGVSARDDAAIIAGVLQFGDKLVGDVMTPRDQVFAVDGAEDPQQVARRVARTGYSRVPVYHGSLDQVQGFLHAFDLLRGPERALALPRPVVRTRPATRCSELLVQLLRDHQHLAIVQEVTGRTLGIVTLEDLLEELVGDIRDEHDEPSPAPA